MGDIIMGFDKVADHIASGTYTGNIIGQYANRLCGGKFSVNGTEYQVTQNEKGKTCLHGGGEYNNALWKAIIIDDCAVEFSYHSPDGTEGFPGNVDVTVVYSLNDHNELEMDYEAVSDKDTILNFTNHAYFNLGTPANGNVLDHELMLNCDFFTPTDADSIPTGEIRSVVGTAFDFRTPKKIGQDIKADFEPLKIGKGYDHCWVIDGAEPGQLQFCCELHAPESGRTLEIYTTQPGVQVYTGNWLTGCPAGKNGHEYKDYEGVAIECQNYPDAPNKADYPSPVLRPGEVYEQAIIFAFNVKE